MNKFLAICLTALTTALPLAQAAATIVEPHIGVAATVATVGSQTSIGILTVTSATGVPGVDSPHYSPKAYFAPNFSSIKAVSAFDGSGFGLSSSGLASADLATGQLKVGAGAIYQRLHNNDYAVGTSAAARFSDVLTVIGDIPSPITVRLSMTVDGSIVADGLGDPTPNDTNSTIAAFFIGDPAGNYAEEFIGNLQGGSLTFQDQSRRPGQVSIDSSNSNSIKLTLSTYYTITSTSRTIAFLADALAEPIMPSSYGSVISDFEHTADLALDLPTGLTFTSLSGVFLSQPQTDPITPADPNTVPEPSTPTLLLAGLLALAVARGKLGLSSRLGDA